MSAADEFGSEWIRTESDPLVHRLRDLTWSSPAGELRERCWDAIEARVGTADISLANGRAGVPSAEKDRQPYACTRPQAANSSYRFAPGWMPRSWGQQSIYRPSLVAAR